jgi:signal peptidase I
MAEDINNNINNTENANKKESAFRKIFLFLWEIVKVVFMASIIVLPIRYFLFQPFIVKGESMMPNFQSGNYLIVDEISYRISEPKRGDVIVFKYPLDTTQKFIKRIIGLPGETVEIKNGKISIFKNNQDITLNEKQYLPDLSGTSGDIKIVLNNKQYFVMGDNREYSYDSRMWGTLPENNIIGKVFIRVLPITEMGTFSSPAY